MPWILFTTSNGEIQLANKEDKRSIVSLFSKSEGYVEKENLFDVIRESLLFKANVSLSKLK
jgi:hypothetical protein